MRKFPHDLRVRSTGAGEILAQRRRGRVPVHTDAAVTDLLNADQAASRLGTDAATLERNTNRGVVPAVHLMRGEAGNPPPRAWSAAVLDALDEATELGGVAQAAPLLGLDAASLTAIAHFLPRTDDGIGSTPQFDLAALAAWDAVVGDAALGPRTERRTAPQLSLDEAAELIGLSPRALRCAVRAGEVPYLATRPLTFDRAALTAWMSKPDHETIEGGDAVAAALDESGGPGVTGHAVEFMLARGGRLAVFATAPHVRTTPAVLTAWCDGWRRGRAPGGRPPRWLFADDMPANARRDGWLPRP